MPHATQEMGFSWTCYVWLALYLWREWEEVFLQLVKACRGAWSALTKCWSRGSLHYKRGFTSGAEAERSPSPAVV
jgi:hypothetical protein